MTGIDLCRPSALGYPNSPCGGAAPAKWRTAGGWDRPARFLESSEVRVLITNDDGIQAEGLHALRRALDELPGVELYVIAPDSNRSATARSITTRSPLWVEEVSFDDGQAGFATDGTPVDCVRFAELGLLGERPELIVSGINHGSNLGDDITYSGTVAAALEGIVLGIPAIAISQQSAAREMDFRLGRSFDFSASAALAAEIVRHVSQEPLPSDTLININCPADQPSGIEVTRLGKRLYDDELKLVEEEEDGGRRRYEIYGFEPSFEDEPGTDLAAVARGQVSITPVHFDLTDEGGLERLRGWDTEAMLRTALGGRAPAR
jgi:5'-nucleotidase